MLLIEHAGVCVCVCVVLVCVWCLCECVCICIHSVGVYECVCVNVCEWFHVCVEDVYEWPL